MIRKFSSFFLLLVVLVGCTQDERSEEYPSLISTPKSTIALTVLPTSSSRETSIPTAAINKSQSEPPQTIVPTRGISPNPTTTPGEMEIPDPVANWLIDNVIPFDSAEPGQGCSDLQPLLEMVGDARIVALGEATHGTHEFFSMKHRIVECLVTEKEFTRFAIEANLPEAEQVNDYVHGGDAQVPMLLDGMYFWTWDTEEVEGLIEWMRQYNQTARDEKAISFQGFDMQFANQVVQDLFSYLKTIDPQIEQDTRQLVNCYNSYLFQRDFYARLIDEEKLECRENLQKVFDLLLENQAALEAASSGTEFAYALQMARMLQQHEMMFAETEIGIAGQLRDTFMAENVQWLLSQGGPDAKMILWAHNGHVQHEPSSVLESESEVFGLPVGYPIKSMGVHLRQEFGEDYLSIGFSFGEGSFNVYPYAFETNSATQGLISISAQPPLPNSHEQYLMALPYPQFILDLRRASSDSLMADWLAEPHWLRAIGAAYDPNKLELTSSWTILPEAFDELIHFQNTSPSRLLDQ